METEVEVLKDVLHQTYGVDYAEMHPHQADHLPVLLQQIKQLQDRLKVESLQKIRLQQVVMSKSQEAQAAVRTISRSAI